MRHGNWEPFLRAELEGTLRRAERAAEAALGAELALIRRLTPGDAHEEIRPAEVRADAGLRDAREAFRARHRELVTLRDECAGFEQDLGMIGRGAHQ